MIGKYTNEDFFRKLTTREQRKCLEEIMSDMTVENARDFYNQVMNIRIKELVKYRKEGHSESDIMDHFFWQSDEN